MVTLVAPQPQPHMAHSDNSKVTENELSAFSVPTESSNRLALVTPSLLPREPISSPSPLVMEIQKPTNISVAMSEVETHSESDTKPAKEAKG